MITKVCTKCGTTKHVEYFYHYSRGSHGRMAKCKECTKKDSNIRYKEKIKQPDFWLHERKRGRDKYHRLYSDGRHDQKGEEKKRTILEYKKKYPEKQLAKNKVQKMAAPDGYEKHHWSYKPQHACDIIYVTTMDHMALHRYIDYNNIDFHYTTKFGINLDTKEKHIEFLENIREIEAMVTS